MGAYNGQAYLDARAYETHKEIWQKTLASRLFSLLMQWNASYYKPTKSMMKARIIASASTRRKSVHTRE